MSTPKIEILPLRAATRSDQPTTLDLLIRITPPMPEVHFVRPPINLGLVLDHSGSMASSKKMAYAIDAACLAVEQLLPTDRLSITIFDTHVETIAPNAPVSDKPMLIRQLKAITPRGATDLHGGWFEGGKEIEKNLIFQGLNRVILLSDGLANQGVTNANVIAREAKALSIRGVSTTTMGLGEDYNEDLMQAMGEAGDGNYYYIESPLQLVDIFQTELQGLMANLGQKVSLGLEPHNGATVSEVLNEFERNNFGRLMLPNLVVGMPISVVVRIKVPAMSNEAETLKVRLAWDEPNGKGRSTLRAGLTLKALPTDAWETLPTEPEVAEQIAFLMAARAKKEAIAAYDRGDMSGTHEHVLSARSEMLAMPASPKVARELEEIAQLQTELDEGEGAKFRKHATYSAYRKRRGHDL